MFTEKIKSLLAVALAGTMICWQAAAILLKKTATAKPFLKESAGSLRVVPKFRWRTTTKVMLRRSR